jgi:hypothetical protein
MGHGRPLESPDNSSTRNPRFTTHSMGVVDTSPLSPAEGRRRGVWTRRRAPPDHLDWAQARGLDVRLHFLVRTKHRQVSARAHSTAETG